MHSADREKLPTIQAFRLVCTVAETNLVDVELGDSCVEQKIEIVKHRDDLHWSTFTGQ